LLFDVVVAAGRHEGELLISTVVGVVGDDVRPVGAPVLVDVEDALPALLWLL